LNSGIDFNIYLKKKNKQNN